MYNSIFMFAFEFKKNKFIFKRINKKENEKKEENEERKSVRANKCKHLK